MSWRFKRGQSKRTSLLHACHCMTPSYEPTLFGCSRSGRFWRKRVRLVFGVKRQTVRDVVVWQTMKAVIFFPHPSFFQGWLSNKRRSADLGGGAVRQWIHASWYDWHPSFFLFLPRHYVRTVQKTTASLCSPTRSRVILPPKQNLTLEPIIVNFFQLAQVIVSFSDGAVTIVTACLLKPSRIF